jgi:hypothetical protein
LDQLYVGLLEFIHAVENAILIVINTAIIVAQPAGQIHPPWTREFETSSGKYFVPGAPQIVRAEL